MSAETPALGPACAAVFWEIAAEADADAAPGVIAAAAVESGAARTGADAEADEAAANAGLIPTSDIEHSNAPRRRLLVKARIDDK